jgi:predicted Ser/Thr protein kinase
MAASYGLLTKPDKPERSPSSMLVLMQIVSDEELYDQGNDGKAEDADRNAHDLTEARKIVSTSISGAEARYQLLTLTEANNLKEALINPKP